MQVIVFTNASGGVSVMTPVLTTNAVNDDGVWLPLRTGQEPPEGYRYPTIEEVATKDAPENHIIIDDSELPDRSKREAWVIQDGKVIVDESRITVPPLSTRLANLLKQAGQQLAADPAPQPETLQLVDAVMTINGKLKTLPKILAVIRRCIGRQRWDT